jgi:hypothetical protein
MKYAVEIASCGIIYFMCVIKFGIGVEAILRLSLRNLKGCNVGITDGRDFFNYTAEIGSGAVIYVPSFIKMGSGIQKLIGGGYSDTQTAWRSYKVTFNTFK